ncbi:hypothetical protein HOD05_04730 [Candidatus Woesearchaeota archaeon]|jgi:hypothetical protein|nr:hypothetical protein [Candidatus Woesearchaeota archaeon]MBT4150458.1 hypothetical protein [Candidatus Woesearchaeota archaeon]MBT4247000.1 hypothetical protein [Candidatus Woesearchaeota archaeon]MBT4434494.1 hypothetical protein [Candidatus Woesearchaeota archaeon]
MTINDKLVQARDIFMATHNDIMEGRKTPVPGSDKYVVSETLLHSFPMLGDALDITEDMSEFEHEKLTRRRAFRNIYQTAKRQHNRFEQGMRGEYTDSSKETRDFMTLSGGMERVDIEQCYRVLDAAVQKVQSDYPWNSSTGRALQTISVQKNGFEYHIQVPETRIRVAVAVDRDGNKHNVEM